MMSNSTTAMPTVKYLDIGADFSRYLGPRYRHVGDFSGEEFRTELLDPAFREYDEVVVALDGIEGNSSSFLEEAFGGLVRDHGLDAVRKKLRFVAVRRKYLVPQIMTYMNEAAVHGPRVFHPR